MKKTFVLCLLFAGCGGDMEPSPDAGSLADSGPARDAGVARDSGAAIDAGDPGEDSGVSADAGEDAGLASDDAGSTTDAGSECSTIIEDRLAGVCDGRGQTACQMWAEMNGGSTAVARCTPPEGRCARADSCTDAGCTCGAGPECGDGEMCVGGVAGFSCVCI